MPFFFPDGEAGWSRHPKQENLSTALGMLQSHQQQAPSWGSGRTETNRDPSNARQWLTDLPPHFVLPKKQRVPPHYLPSQFVPCLFETQAAMGSPDWNVCPQHIRSCCSNLKFLQGVFKFEGDVAFSAANPIPNADTNDLLASGPQQNNWSAASYHLSSQPVPAPVPSNGQAVGLGGGWSSCRASNTSQSSGMPHQSSVTHFNSGIWPLPLIGNISPDHVQPCTTSYKPVQTNFNPFLAAAAPSMVSSSYSSTGAMAFGPQVTNNISYGNVTGAESPMVSPQTLHNGSWDFFDPMNQYPGIAGQSLGSSQAPFDMGSSGLSTNLGAPSLPPASTQAAHMQNQAQTQASLADDPMASLSPTWPEWQVYGSNGFSSDSEMASPVSPTIPAHMQASLDNHSFSGSLDSNNSMAMPALTYSQGSPASDWEDISSSYPGEQRHARDGNESTANLSRRSRGPQAQNNNTRFAMLPYQGVAAAERDPPPPPPPVDGYTRIRGNRARKDELLVRWKKSGMSYRQIREQGGFTEAESTLRGRFRTLTKCREERVRKPLWTAEDVSVPDDVLGGLRLMRGGKHRYGCSARASKCSWRRRYTRARMRRRWTWMRWTLTRTRCRGRRWPSTSTTTRDRTILGTRRVRSSG